MCKLSVSSLRKGGFTAFEAEVLNYVVTNNIVVGTSFKGVPNVPRFLSGRPDNMYNVKTQTYKNTKVLTLVYFVGANWEIKADDLAKAGAKLLRVIATLEGKGYRINQNVATHAKAANKTHDILTLFVKIKDSGKHLNLAKVAYPIAHPAYFRFHVWKWLDTQTEVVNYGNNSDNFDNMCKKFNKNAKW